MTYYTIMPLDTSMDVELTQSFQEMFTKDGIPFVGERLSNGAVKVNRIISTDPNDYLSKAIVPGVIINNLE